MTGTLPPDPPIEDAIRLLHSEDVQIRQVVAYLLGQTGSPRAVEPLIAALNDANPGVRGAAANALGALGDRRAVTALLPLLDHSSPQLVVWAAYALTRLGDDHFDMIAAALASPDVDVCRSGVLALHQLGDARAIPHLLTLRDDPRRRFPDDLTVGEAAVRALASLGHTQD